MCEELKLQMEDAATKFRAAEEGGRPAFAGNHADGMSLRDYFAAAAMQALITKLGPYEDDPGAPNSFPSGRDDVPNVHELAMYAYSQADAMCLIRELEA